MWNQGLSDDKTVLANGMFVPQQNFFQKTMKPCFLGWLRWEGMS